MNLGTIQDRQAAEGDRTRSGRAPPIIYPACTLIGRAFWCYLLIQSSSIRVLQQPVSWRSAVLNTFKSRLIATRFDGLVCLTQ